jgi:hypothetical protein
MEKHALIIEFDTGRFPFHEVLAAEFGTPRLSQLHLTRQRTTGRAELTYADNLALRRQLEQMPDASPFSKLYDAWVAAVVAPKYGTIIRYSAHPKMRVHLAGTGGVSNFHRDADITGRHEQINCYLPFTDVEGTGTLWSETTYGARDYAPINLRYGQALIWDGGWLLHGSYPNETSSTRVSCDFRFDPLHPERVESPWRDVLAGRPAIRPAPEPAAPPRSRVAVKPLLSQS